MRDELKCAQGTAQVGPVPGTYASVASKPEGQRVVPPQNKLGQEQRQYWRARRSSRFFPVPGVTDEELKSSLKHFCLEKLRIPSEDLNEADVEHVRRVRLRRGKPGLDEVTVLFTSVEARDRVVSYARNLGLFVDIQGKPTAGIRFEIPDHLTGVHRTLLQYGHAMHTKYRRDKNFKRNIRFDDVEMTFCLDIKFPGRENWITVKHERALRDRRTSTNADADDHEELLSSAGQIPVVGMEEEEGTGVEAAGGCVTRTSWRAPTGK